MVIRMEKRKMMMRRRRRVADCVSIAMWQADPVLFSCMLKWMVGWQFPC